MRDNPYITTGYRIGFRGVKAALKTMFMWHNETVNVWSHFLAKLASFVLIFIVFAYCPSYGKHGHQLNQ
jgi:adiponectin receptor